MPLGTELGLSPGDFVLDGDPAPPEKGGGAPKYVYCGQTAGWIKMALGMEVGLGPIHIVLDGDTYSFPPRRGGRAPPPIFGPYLLWSNGCMHEDATWYGARPQRKRQC